MFLPSVYGLGDFDLGLMLLSLIVMADVIAYVHYCRCYCHMADVLPFVFGLRDFDSRLMLLPHIDMG